MKNQFCGHYSILRVLYKLASSFVRSKLIRYSLIPRLPYLFQRTREKEVYEIGEPGDKARLDMTRV